MSLEHPAFESDQRRSPVGIGVACSMSLPKEVTESTLPHRSPGPPQGLGPAWNTKLRTSSARRWAVFLMAVRIALRSQDHGDGGPVIHIHMPFAQRSGRGPSKRSGKSDRRRGRMTWVSGSPRRTLSRSLQGLPVHVHEPHEQEPWYGIPRAQSPNGRRGDAVITFCMKSLSAKGTGDTAPMPRCWDRCHHHRRACSPWRTAAS